MTTWLTQRQAAELLGLTVSGVGHLVDNGRLRSNGRHYDGSIARNDAETLAEELAKETRKAKEALARRLIAREARRIWPPDNEHDWLSMGQAAELLGVTRRAIRHRCDRGTLPFAWSSGKRWVRRDLLELR